MTGQTQVQRRWTRRPEGSNWGDFGPDDQLGRMNLITPKERLAALREVREGKVFVLSLPLDYPGGEAEDAPRRAPRLFSNRLQGLELFNGPLTETDICCDDGVTLSLQYSTQWDALVHWGRLFDIDGSGKKKPVYYNGFRAGADTHCIRYLVEHKQEVLEVRQEAYEDYMDRTGSKLDQFVWSTTYGTSYFRNASGRVTTNSPWSLLEMWTWTMEPNLAHFLTEGAGEELPAQVDAGLADRV